MATIIKKFQIYGFKNFVIFSIIEIGRLMRRQFLKSFSQNREDLIIDKILNKKNISYVDIGSNHPIKFNNTYRFYLQGSHGINIEPNPSLINKYQLFRPKDENLNTGIANQKKSLTFYQLDPDVGSTFSKTQANETIKKGSQLVSQYPIKILTLENVFKKYYKNKKVDLLSIDTEGYDYQVLQSNDWSKYQPTIICIEDNTLKTQQYLINKNYSLKAITVNNSIYLNEKQ